MLKYALVENVMTTDPHNCIAVVSSPEVKDLNDVIDFMIAEGTGLTRPQAMAYFEKLTQTIEYFLGEGHRVVTPLVRVRLSISGVFNNKKDYFDSSRHKLNIRTSSGLRLRELPSKIKLEKVEVSQQAPLPELFEDGSSREVNLLASPGGIGVLKGNRLKFDPDDNALGIFFIPVEDTANETRVDVYSGVKPSEIHFQIPDLPAGEYAIAVKTKSLNGSYIQKGELKEIISISKKTLKYI